MAGGGVEDRGLRIGIKEGWWKALAHSRVDGWNDLGYGGLLKRFRYGKMAFRVRRTNSKGVHREGRKESSEK